MFTVARRVLAVGVVVSFVAGCGGSSSGPGASGACTGSTVAAGIDTTGAVCADTGLRPASGGFSFENWAGPVAQDAVTSTTAIAIFGKDAVCAQSTDTSCTPFPAVSHWIDASNSQIQGGRCEGMAVLSQRLFDGANTPAQLQATATKTFDLQKPTIPVAGTISRWWVSQGFENVLQATNRAAQMRPSEIVGKLIDAITNKAGATIGIYANGGGHAITPIAVTKADDGKYAVLVYDNNFPGKVTSLSVDPATETWTYDVGAMNAGAAAAVWSGGTGSMDFALMADREGEQKVPWSNDDRAAASKGSARISVSTGGASYAGLIVTVGNKTIDSRDLSTVTAGVKVFPNRGGIGTGALVEIPAGLTNVKITPVVGQLLDPNDTAVDLVVGVDAPGPGSQLVTDELTGDDLTDGTYDDFSLDISTDDGYDSTIDVADDGNIDVGVAYEEESLDATLEDGQDLSVSDPEAEGDFSLDVTSQDGESLYEASFDGTDDDGQLGVTNLDIDEATGEAVVEEAPIEAETLNTDLLDIAQADAEKAAENAANDSTDNSTTDNATSDNSTSDNSTSDNSTPNSAVTDNSTTDSPGTPAQDDGSSGSDQSPESTNADSTDDAPETTQARSTKTTVDDNPPPTDPPADDNQSGDDN